MWRFAAAEPFTSRAGFLLRRVEARRLAGRRRAVVLRRFDFVAVLRRRRRTGAFLPIAFAAIIFIAGVN